VNCGLRWPADARSDPNGSVGGGGAVSASNWLERTCRRGNFSVNELRRRRMNWQELDCPCGGHAGGMLASDCMIET
jgi:hypothetical protein